VPSSRRLLGSGTAETLMESSSKSPAEFSEMKDSGVESLVAIPVKVYSV
jgi:hypothetical protein